MKQDNDLLALLEKDPEQGMAALIQEYSGLLWTVCRQYLTSSEDVKECVNETFSQFYLHRHRFDPKKGSLKGYLAAIGRRCAIHQYQENRRWEGAAEKARPALPDPFDQLEQEDALERALAALDPADQEILRLKYYQGMTAREIAVSLGIPYETVKKRHQRGLKKLLRLLALGLVIAVLAAALAACAYLILRHLGFVPGYGVNASQELPLYTLEEGVAVEDGPYQIHLKDAYWRGGFLFCDLKLYQENGLEPEVLDVQLQGLETDQQALVSEYGGGVNHRSYRIIWEGDLPEKAPRLELTLTVKGVEVPFVLLAAEEVSLEEAGFYAVTSEDGGLLAVPRLENGELVVSIHPLNQGDFSTYPFLNQGVWKGYGGPSQPLTVVAEDGTVLEGEPAPYIPFNGDSYQDWNFGPAQPGEYTLRVPSVYQKAAGEETLSVEIPLDQEFAPQTLELPGGTLTLRSLRSVEDAAPYSPARSQLNGGDVYRWWTLEAVWKGENEERSLAVPYATIPADGRGDSVQIEGVLYPAACVELWVEAAGEEETGPCNMCRGYVLGAMEGQDTVRLSLNLENLFYRWDHEFAIPMTVEPEPEREVFTAGWGEYQLTAVPRRVNGEVVLSLTPSALREGETVWGNILQNPYGVQEGEAITLTAADGTVYQGQFQPGREETFSNWVFGDLPAGEYTLTVPALTVTVEGEWDAEIPLPQKEGEVLSSDPVSLGRGSVRLAAVEGLGLDETFPLGLGSMVIAQSSGAISPPEEPPLASSAVLELISEEEDYTLLDFSLRLDITEEGYFLGACQRQYDASGALTGLLLRHVPGLSSATLTFVDPVYRWERPVQLGVTLPE